MRVACGFFFCVSSLAQFSWPLFFLEMMGTGLHLAAQKGHTAMLKHLLRTKKFRNHLDTRDKEGNTALMLAVVEDRAQCFEVLQQAGASVTVKTHVLGIRCFLSARRKTRLGFCLFV
eukprot:m.749523 g.749523  ORF g.749523 m.749523 type:complete len:117 (+) comp58977_c0_seq5:66-416(+)